MSKYYDSDVEKYGKNVAPQLPWSIQLCITYGCNRAPLSKNRYTNDNGEIDCKNGCMFCGVASLIDKTEDKVGFNHMTVDTAVEIAKQLNDWVPGRRIEINNFGEPFLNPNWRGIIKALRDNYPSVCIQLQTNGINSYLLGYEKFKELVDDFYENGGNLLAIDAYEGSYPTYMEFAKRYGEETGITVVDFMHDNPNKLTYYRNAGSSARELYVVDDLGECDYKEKTTKDKKAQRNINNHAGCMDHSVWSQYGINQSYLPLEKKCSRVFREIIIGFDGAVTICCQDFLRRVNLGTIKDTNIRDIWNSEEFNTIRKLLFDKDRGFCTPCSMCSYTGGFRLGFLKRPEGEVTPSDLNKLYELQDKYSNLIHYNGKSSITIDGEVKTINSTMSRELALKGELV